MSQPRSYNTPAIILKRSNIGETDRILTLLTKEKGKITVIAKGCRKMSSTKRGYLELGNHIDAFLIPTKSMHLLTQARLVEDFVQIKQTLKGIKKLFQVLEIIDTLLIEEENPDQFDEVREMIYFLNKHPENFTPVQKRLETLIASLGFQHREDTTYQSVLEYVSAVAERPMHSYDYLTVKHG